MLWMHGHIKRESWKYVREEGLIFRDYLHILSILRDLDMLTEGKDSTVRTSLNMGRMNFWLSFLHSVRVYYMIKGVAEY